MTRAFCYGHGRIYGPARPTRAVGAPATRLRTYDDYQLACLATAMAQEEHARVMRWQGRRVALIACSATKADAPMRAIDLYRGDLVRKARAWAERHCDETWILSAKHGLIEADTVIEPYDEVLEKRTLGPWSQRVGDRFRALGMYLAADVVLLAGELYRMHLEWLAGTCGWTHVRAPLAHMGIGEQKAWLKAGVEPAQPQLFREAA